MTTYEHYIMDTNIRDEFDIYFTLNEKLRLLNRELKRTKKKIIVNQFIQNHFINDASYGGDYFWVDNDYVNEFNDKLCSYMLHHECVKITINNIIKEINDGRYKMEEKADEDDDQPPVEEETHHEDDDEEFLREVESTPDIDFIETYNCEYDGEYYINNDADERYNGGVGGVGGDEFDDEDNEDEVEEEDEEEEEGEDDEEEVEVNIDDEFKEEEEGEEEEEVDDEFEEEEEGEEEEEVDDEFEEEEEDEGFDDNGEKVTEVTEVRVNIPISSVKKTPVDNNHMVPIFPLFLLNKIIGFFSGGK